MQLPWSKQPSSGRRTQAHPVPSADASTLGHQGQPAAASSAAAAAATATATARAAALPHPPTHPLTHSPPTHPPPSCRFFEEELAEACSPLHYNIHLLAYGPLAGGTLSGKYLGGAKPEGARHSKWPGEADGQAVPVHTATTNSPRHTASMQAAVHMVICMQLSIPHAHACPR
jgi:aryl-alcohol dehydrogenase-like predicted oxidoreductase